jgi:hypothetical protein
VYIFFILFFCWIEDIFKAKAIFRGFAFVKKVWITQCKVRNFISLRVLFINAEIEFNYIFVIRKISIIYLLSHVVTYNKAWQIQLYKMGRKSFHFFRQVKAFISKSFKHDDEDDEKNVKSCDTVYGVNIKHRFS